MSSLDAFRGENALSGTAMRSLLGVKSQTTGGAFSRIRHTCKVRNDHAQFFTSDLPSGETGEPGNM